MGAFQNQLRGIFIKSKRKASKQASKLVSKQHPSIRRAIGQYKQKIMFSTSLIRRTVLSSSRPPIQTWVARNKAYHCRAAASQILSNTRQQQRSKSSSSSAPAPDNAEGEASSSSSSSSDAQQQPHQYSLNEDGDVPVPPTNTTQPQNSEFINFPASSSSSSSSSDSRQKGGNLETQPLLLNAKEHVVGYLSRILNARVYDVAVETDLQHAKNLSTVSLYFLKLVS